MDLKLLKMLCKDSKQHQEVHEGRVMAWKRLRPKILRTPVELIILWIYIHLSATIVGMIYYLGFETGLNCEDRSKESIPAKLQWIITISAIFFVSSLYCY